MQLLRRDVLGGAAGALPAAPVAAQPPAALPGPALPQPSARLDWPSVRAMFTLARDRVDMSAMLIASHPRPVRDAIERYRRALDETPVEYLHAHNRRLQNAARARAGRYMGVAAEDVALTDSTTMGVALVYNGLKLRPGQEVLTTRQDYYVTHEALRLKAERSGCTVRRIPLYDRLDGITADALADRIAGEIRPSTRVLALTWVHSSTGLKLPLKAIGERVRGLNAARGDNDRVLVCVDGVHGFGNQHVSIPELGCDFLIAGCHKWLFGPRGTGVVFGSKAGWAAASPTIPSFLDSEAYGDWISGTPAAETTGALMTPGGFKAFEHLWALGDAFVLHELAGRDRVAARTAELAEQLKTGLAAMPHVRLHTPRSRELSAGIVAFDIDGVSPHAAVAGLRERRVIASVAPYATPHVRLTPSIRNFPEEVNFALDAVRALKA